MKRIYVTKKLIRPFIPMSSLLLYSPHDNPYLSLPPNMYLLSIDCARDLIFIEHRLC